MTKLVAVVGAISIAALVVLSCDNSFFLRGTVNGDCDPPSTIIAQPGGSDTPTLRKSNCQPTDAICCRRSAKAVRTSCQYPEDCFVAPYQGACATAVDCADTQTCTGGSCQCVDTRTGRARIRDARGHLLRSRRGVRRRQVHGAPPTSTVAPSHSIQ